MSSSSVSEIVLEIVCPTLGAVSANLMFAAPLFAVQAAVQRGSLGDLNPTPWAFMTGNCLGWVMYSVLLHNVYIFVANCPGLILSVYFNLCATKLQTQHTTTQQLRQSLLLHVVGSASTADASAADRIGVENADAEDENYEEAECSSPAEQLEMGPVNGSAAVEAVSNESTMNDHSKEFIDEDADCADVSMTNQITTRVNLTNGTKNEPASSSEATKPLGDGHKHEEQEQHWTTIIWDVTSQQMVAPAPHERVVMGIVLVWTILLSIVGLTKALSADTQQFMIGIAVNINLTFFYGAPLSTIYNVVRERNSASIHVPTFATNTLNGLFWTAYGIAVQDYFVSVPNGIGAGLGVIQLLLLLVLPRRLQQQ